ncbi:MAG TPA: glycoside hydrolase family 127 protein, partial [Paludibacter sp.]|nr:glycoside hydrolase family 127 protein [Paludibacter sp.]
VADVYAETGEEQLMKNLTSIWNDIVYRKMYVTGACGALYDGTSPDGTFYTPDSIQKVHQSYGRPYQLPNSTAHNETCANIGNLLFNWRMLQVTGEAKYADIVETALYNSILSGISLDGKRFFYTNPLKVSKDLPYTLRWSKKREEYIKLCNCCPPNTVRTLTQVQNYAYSIAGDMIYFNLYGGNEFKTSFGKKESLKITQTTDYPWDGKIIVEVAEAPKKKMLTFQFRIPSWCDNATITVNGQTVDTKIVADTYIPVNRQWKKGDKVEINLEMKAKLLESHPLVEETRNQTAIKRGPIVYCLEGVDVQGGKSIDNVLIPADIQFTTRKEIIDGSSIVVLDGTAKLTNEDSWKNTLYRPVQKSDNKVKITLIPYFTWGNRGKMDMTVWMPLNP